MDLEAHRRWYDYSRARDDMFAATDTPESPWYVVDSNEKRRARLNCIAHFLSLIPYEEVPRPKVVAAQAPACRRLCRAGLSVPICPESILIVRRSLDRLHRYWGAISDADISAAPSEIPGMPSP